MENAIVKRSTLPGKASGTLYGDMLEFWSIALTGDRLFTDIETLSELRVQRSPIIVRFRCANLVQQLYKQVVMRWFD